MDISWVAAAKKWKMHMDDIANYYTFRSDYSSEWFENEKVSKTAIHSIEIKIDPVFAIRNVLY